MADNRVRSNETTSTEAFLPVLLQILQEQLGRALTPDLFGADLSELGVDSLMAIEIAHRLEDALGVTIDDRDVLGFRNIDSICATLQRSVTTPSQETRDVL